MTLAQHLPLNLVDNLLAMVTKFIFGDLSRHGIRMPKMGPMTLKSKTGRSAVIDVGTVGLIKRGIIQVSISKEMIYTLYVYHMLIYYGSLIIFTLCLIGSRKH
jgi:indole-3-pyruvate monooxygenase